MNYRRFVMIGLFTLAITSFTLGLGAGIIGVSTNQTKKEIEKVRRMERIERRTKRAKEIIFKKLDKHSVSIFGVKSKILKCSGVVIKEDEDTTHIISCAHCLTSLSEYYVEKSKVRYAIGIPGEDLLYIVADRLKDKEPVKLANETAPLEEKVYHAGYPSMVNKYTSEGKVIRYTDDWGWAELAVKGGCSGGGVFNKNKELVGIVWGQYKSEGVAVFEPITDVKIFLDKVKIIIGEANENDN